MRRASVAVTPDGRRLSALVWGEGPPDLVLLHGGAQNAHTWDTVALALDRPLVALDLPGHGHSDHRAEGPFGPRLNATDVAAALRVLAPDSRLVVGMSLGGLTGIALTNEAPALVRRLALVDVTPGVDRDKAAPIAQFIAGPESFESFDEILARTIQYNPTRTESSLRRGILHNAEQREDGSWVWRYQRFRAFEPKREEGESGHPNFGYLWDAVGRIQVPVLLTRGMREQSVVDDDDEVELLRRLPDAQVEHFEEAGHSLQGDTPVELAQSIERFAFTT